MPDEKILVADSVPDPGVQEGAGSQEGKNPEEAHRGSPEPTVARLSESELPSATPTVARLSESEPPTPDSESRATAAELQVEMTTPSGAPLDPLGKTSEVEEHGPEEFAEEIEESEEEPAEPPPQPTGKASARSPGPPAHGEKKAGATPGPTAPTKPATNPAPAQVASGGSQEEARPNPKRWYVVKVQSGREEAIKEAIERKVRKDGLEEFYGQIIIPVEKITEVRTDRSGKRVTRTKERKLYPGYIMAEVEYNDRVLYLFRETSGVGDFVGASADRDKPPPPMTEREVLRMLGPANAPDTPAVAAKPRFMEIGARVRVADGTFAGMEGEVKEILEAVGKLRVELTIFGRPVPVELEYYQVEQT